VLTLKRVAVAFVALVALLLATASAQEAPPRILEQDPELDNLITPPGYSTGVLGELGDVRRTGDGAETMLLIPGFGFGGDVFSALTTAWSERFTMWAVTLPGFGGTPAPPTPPAATSFGEQTWTRAAGDATSELLVEKGLTNVVVVGHWLGGTQVALEIARRHPDRVRAVVLLAGSARWVPSSGAEASVPTLEQRVAGVDGSLAPRWFRTVTRATWDDNNFLPGDYAANPVIGLRLWRRAAEPALHVWVRYLCEFYAQDSTLLLADLSTPTLVLQPGLEGTYHDPGNNYLHAYVHTSWGESLRERDAVTTRTLPNTRIVMWADTPAVVVEQVEQFLDRAHDAR
jgi:pimeloyl-ACP methyl ester carboxylesterase